MSIYPGRGFTKTSKDPSADLTQACKRLRSTHSSQNDLPACTERLAYVKSRSSVCVCVWGGGGITAPTIPYLNFVSALRTGSGESQRLANPKASTSFLSLAETLIRYFFPSSSISCEPLKDEVHLGSPGNAALTFK